jgi:carboxyl-terminal processing protease
MNKESIIKVSKKNNFKYVLVAAISGFLFFAVGYNLKRLPLPESLKGSTVDNSKLELESGVTIDLDEIINELKDKYDGEITNDQLIESIKRGVAGSTGDPYTTYFSAEEAADFQTSLSGEFSGIGAELNNEGGSIGITAPIDDSPAQKAGLSTGDTILMVDGESTDGWTVETAVKKIRGPSGTTVKLKVVTALGEIKEVSIVRETIKNPSVKAEVINGNIGYIRISTFGQDTLELTSKAADDFKSQGLNKVIIDLRNNGGGYLDTAVGLASLWLPKDTLVVQSKAKGKIVDKQYSSGIGTLTGFKTVILTNGGSASASEILAGALHDHGVATLIGETTFGKGSVQSLTKLKDGSELKITIARWFTPNDKNIDKEGIKPDIEVKLSLEDIQAKKDSVKDRAIEELNK